MAESLINPWGEDDDDFEVNMRRWCVISRKVIRNRILTVDFCFFGR